MTTEKKKSGSFAKTLPILLILSVAGNLILGYFTHTYYRKANQETGGEPPAIESTDETTVLPTVIEKPSKKERIDDQSTAAPKRPVKNPQIFYVPEKDEADDRRHNHGHR